MTAIDMTPEGLKATVDVHLEKGNNMAVEEIDFVETLEWMEEELQAEVDDPTAKIPINKKGARYVYTFNPREVKYYPLLIQAAGREILLDDAIRLATAARATGTDVRLEIEPGLWHAWQLFAGLLPEADQAIDRAARFIEQRMGRQ